MPAVNMKTLFVLLCVVVLSQQGPILSYYQRMKMNIECIEQTGISKDFVRNVINSVKVPVNDTLYQEYLTCFYKKQKFQNEDGVINFANLQEFLETFYSSDAAKLAVDRCRELSGETHGETAALVGKCVIENLFNLENNQSTNKEEEKQKVVEEQLEDNAI